MAPPRLPKATAAGSYSAKTFADANECLRLAVTSERFGRDDRRRAPEYRYGNAHNEASIPSPWMTCNGSTGCVPGSRTHSGGPQPVMRARNLHENNTVQTTNTEQHPTALKNPAAQQPPPGSENASLIQHGLAAGEPSPIRKEGDDPTHVRLRPCYGKDCAEMLTTRGLRIVSTCPRVNKMSTFKC